MVESGAAAQHLHPERWPTFLPREEGHICRGEQCKDLYRARVLTCLCGVRRVAALEEKFAAAESARLEAEREMAVAEGARDAEERERHRARGVLEKERGEREAAWGREREELERGRENAWREVERVVEEGRRYRGEAEEEIARCNRAVEECERRVTQAEMEVRVGWRFGGVCCAFRVRRDARDSAEKAQRTPDPFVVIRLITPDPLLTCLILS